MNSRPLVTILITARNRPEELRQTLREVKRQCYVPLELVVFDDASDVPLEPVVRCEFPEATVSRNETPRGYIVNRSSGMRQAQGKYIISLDDDSCFTNEHDIEIAVERLEREPELAVLSFFVFHGPTLPEQPLARTEARYGVAFIGCGHVLRKAAIDQVGAYRDFYFYYGEETELSLRLLNAGWRILTFPQVLIHHRVSQKNRRHANILRYSMRNNIWTILLNMPWRRAFLQGGWRLVSYSIECLRMGQPLAWMKGLVGIVGGLPRVLKLREPIRQETVGLYDALRAQVIRTPEEYVAIQPPGWRATMARFWSQFRNRPRARSFWDRRPHDVGRSEDSAFAHQFAAVEKPK